MTAVLWLSGAAAALMIWWYGNPPSFGIDRGTISEQWLHNHRRDTHGA